MVTTSRRTFLALSAMATASSFLPAPVFNKDFISDDWPDHGRGREQTRFNPQETIIGPKNVSHLRLRWEFEAGCGITGTPAVVGGRGVFCLWGGCVFALNRLSGKITLKVQC